MAIRNIKNNPIPIGVVILILVMAILNFVMITELPYFVSGLQIKSKADGPDIAPPNAVESLDNAVYILYQNRRYDQRLVKKK